jgi:hypothetical protein
MTRSYPHEISSRHTVGLHFLHLSVNLFFVFFFIEFPRRRFSRTITCTLGIYNTPTYICTHNNTYGNNVMKNKFSVHVCGLVRHSVSPSPSIFWRGIIFPNLSIFLFYFIFWLSNFWFVSLSISLDTAKFVLVNGHAIFHDSVRHPKEQLFLFNFRILWRIWNWRGKELLPFEWLDYYTCAAASLDTCRTVSCAPRLPVEPFNYFFFNCRSLLLSSKFTPFRRLVIFRPRVMCSPLRIFFFPTETRLTHTGSCHVIMADAHLKWRPHAQAGVGGECQESLCVIGLRMPTY